MADGNGKIVVLTAPSGAGKTTIARAVMEQIPVLRFSVSATTRPPRAHERDGVHYHFVTEAQFRRFIDDGALIEYEEVYPGRFYGTLRAEVDRATPEAPLLLDIDVEGALNVKRQYGDRALTLFIRPPSLEALAERLRGRATETEETLRVRLETARREIGYAPPDVAQADDAERPLEELRAAVAPPRLPPVAFDGGGEGHEPARVGQHQQERLLGDGDRRAAGRVHDGHAPRRRGPDVHVVQPDAYPRDDAERRAGVDQRLRHDTPPPRQHGDHVLGLRDPEGVGGVFGLQGPDVCRQLGLGLSVDGFEQEDGRHRAEEQGAITRRRGTAWPWSS